MLERRKGERHPHAAPALTLYMVGGILDSEAVSRIHYGQNEGVG
jgi:hypothetical protein